MIFDIDADNDSFIDFLHASSLACQPRAHDIGSFDKKLDGSLIGGESGVHVRILVDGFEEREAFIHDKNEVQLFIHHDVFRSMIFARSDLVWNYFPFLWKQNLDLLLCKFRIFQQRCPKLFYDRFTRCCLMTCLLNLFQHTTIMGMYIKYRDIFFDLNISEFQKMSSHNKYIELTDELQFTKKELANYRQKYQISTRKTLTISRIISFFRRRNSKFKENHRQIRRYHFQTTPQQPNSDWSKAGNPFRF